ncbi:hypothetical protein BN133_255 [Cronobacter dublinensis 582]|nr:hypothetical protein BN133_255 [Cronobacter dublinensis 582]
MFQRADKRQVHQLRHDKRHDGDFNRRFNILTGVEPRRQHLHHNQPHQPHRIRHQCLLRHERVVAGEFAVLEQRHGKRLCENAQRHGARQRQQKAQAQAPVHQTRILVMVAAGEASRQRRQQNGAERDAQHPGRELHQAIGVIHPRHRAGDQKRGENSVDDERDLAYRHAENGGPHLLHHPHRARVFKVDARQHQHADFLQVRQLIDELQHAADRYRPGERQHGRVKVRRGKQRKTYHADVQEGRRECRNREAVPGVKNGAGERGQ